MEGRRKEGIEIEGIEGITPIRQRLYYYFLLVPW